MNISRNILNTLTDKQKKMAEAARSPEELLSIAKEAGQELTQDQLEAVSGGAIWAPGCPEEGYCPQDGDDFCSVDC